TTSPASAPASGADVLGVEQATARTTEAKSVALMKDRVRQHAAVRFGGLGTNARTPGVSNARRSLMHSLRGRPLLAIGIAAFVLLVDSVSKAWAVDSLAHGPWVLLPSALELTYAENPGVAFSMFAEAPSIVRLGVLPALALGAAFLFFFRA